jgi:hypothetical protein
MMIVFRFGFPQPSPASGRQPGGGNLPKDRSAALLSLAALDMAHRPRHKSQIGAPAKALHSAKETRQGFLRFQQKLRRQPLPAYFGPGFHTHRHVLTDLLKNPPLEGCAILRRPIREGAQMENWITGNAWWLLPLAVGALAQWEITKLNRRIDSILFLLKRKGIDIFDRSTDADLD